MMTISKRTVPAGPLNSKVSTPRIVAFATQGPGGNDEQRISALLTEFKPEIFAFHWGSLLVKLRNTCSLLKHLRKEKPDLLVMEGTGIAGGISALAGRFFLGIPYFFSSGDAIAPFVAGQVKWAGPIFLAYEKMLYRNCAGFIGWTPYLCGRALTYGAPRAVTIPGWAPGKLSRPALEQARNEIRASLAIPPDALVIGIAGSLAWNARVGYCYGLELVRALKLSQRRDVYVLIVGEGPGKDHLMREAGVLLNDKRILFTGRVSRSDVPRFLAAMDVGSIPQSLDQAGQFRYTTKLPEYLANGLPAVTGQLPMAYDLDSGWLWRIQGKNPWDDSYCQALSIWIDNLSPEEICGKRDAAFATGLDFDFETQKQRLTSFINETMAQRK